MRVILLLSLLVGTVWTVPCITKAIGTTVPGITAPGNTDFTTANGTGSTPEASTVSSGSSIITDPSPKPLELDAASSSSTVGDCTTETVTPVPSDQSTQSTVPQTPAPTTLPQVNVSYVQFTFGNCQNGYCSYTYLAPKNDPGVIVADSNIVATDSSIYDNDVFEVNTYNNSLQTIVLFKTGQVDKLQQQLNYAQEMLNEMVADLQATIDNISNATTTLKLPNTYINSVATGGSNDCFNKCTLPPTTPAPTTTPTSAPTTTMAFCNRRENVEAYCENHGKCAIDSGGTYCTGCTGNEDRYHQCLISFCYEGDGTDATDGPFWSPGYNDTAVSANDTAASGGKTCVWNYNQALTMNITNFNFTNLAISPSDMTKPFVYLVPLDGDDLNNINFVPSLTPKNFNSYLKLKTNAGLTKYSINVRTPTAPTVVPFFYWYFNPFPNPAPTAASG